MKVKNRKLPVGQTRTSAGTAATADVAMRKRSGAKNRVERYFRDCPAELPFEPAGPACLGQSRELTSRRHRRGVPGALPAGRPHRSGTTDQPLLRRLRASRIGELRLEYMPSREFDQPHAEQRITGGMPTPSTTSRKVRPPAGLPSYLASLYETPLLTREQELHLFRKYNYLKYRAANLREKLNPARPQVRLMDQIERLYKEAVATKNQIIQANLRLVVSIMKRYVTENDGTFELISEGNVSLIRAVEKFDYTRGFRFSTYASWAIQKNNAREFANDIKRRIRFQTSQDESLANCPQKHFDPVRAERAQQERADQVAQVLKRLDQRDRQIIEGRFGLAGNQESKTLKEVGEEMGVSKERVRQLERRAMERLRELAREANLRDSLE